MNNRSKGKRKKEIISMVLKKMKYIKRDSFIYKVNLKSILILYSIIGIIFLKYYQYHIAPDNISYISIAQKYLAGDFGNAINGHWSPFVSWLLIPFLYFKIRLLLAYLIISLIIGLFTLMGIRSLTYKFEMKKEIRNLILVLLVPIILKFVFSNYTADLLIVFFLILYFNVIFNDKYPNKKYYGLLCGVYGGLGYLSKSFAFPYFLFHFIIFNLIHYYKNTKSPKRKAILNNFLLGILFFFIICGPWIYIISSKYNHFTINNSTKYNWSFIAPESKGHPMLYQGLVAPPNNTAISAWEDPGYFEKNEWSPVKSWNSFKYEIKYFLKNVFNTISVLEKFSKLSIIILFFYLLLAIMPVKKLISQGAILYPLLSVLLYCAGYCLILVRARYLWINNILLIIMGGYLINILLQSELFNRIRKTILLLFFAVEFSLIPVYDIISNINIQKDIYTLSQKLENEFNIHGNIASNKYICTLYISYYINARFYGKINENLNDEGLYNEMKEKNIDYYFYWDEDSNNYNFIRNNYKEITDGEIPGLKIYSLKDDL